MNFYDYTCGDYVFTGFLIWIFTGAGLVFAGIGVMKLYHLESALAKIREGEGLPKSVHTSLADKCKEPPTAKDESQ